MPKRLIARSLTEFVWEEYELRELQPDQVRIRSHFAAAKHGTELNFLGGTEHPTTSVWDDNLELFRPLERERPPRPGGVGNMVVGEVIEVGDAVAGFTVGDMVFAHSGFQDIVTKRVDHDLHHLPGGMSWQSAVCADPVEFALGAVRDGHVGLGDRVVVFGLGAIGLCLVQCARLQGAGVVYAVDPIEIRRKVAVELGADEAFDPTKVDVALLIKEKTKAALARLAAGCDVAFEVSGSAGGLAQAIRSVAYGGTVVAVAMYKPFRTGFDLGREFHRNRLRIVSSRACSEPVLEHPRWDNRRIQETAIRLLAEGKLVGDPIVHPVVPAAEAGEAYRRCVVEHPETSIKLGLDYTAGAP